MKYDTAETILSTHNGNSDSHAIQHKIDKIVLEYDAEILKLQKNANMAYYSMLVSLLVCSFIFISPNIFPKYSSEALNYPGLVQDSIDKLTEIQKKYNNKIEYNQKRFNDVRQLQEKLGPELQNFYFVLYEDDPIFSNLLFRYCNGPSDTGANQKKLAFGGEIPISPAHNPLNNKVAYIRLNGKDTLQDKNLYFMRSGIVLLKKTIADSIGVLEERRDQSAMKTRASSEVPDNMSIRAGAIIILIFSISILAYMQRYFHQMKHFYLSRRNMIKLLSLRTNEIQSVGIEGLLKSLSPDHIEMKLPTMRNSEVNKQAQ